MKDLYSRWGNYIPNDLREQFQDEWLEVEARITEMEEEIKAYKAVESIQDGNIPALAKKMFGNQKPKI